VHSGVFRPIKNPPKGGSVKAADRCGRS
jgi:hypothetical protein